MSKKMLKVMSILLIAVCMVAMVSTSVMATDYLNPDKIVASDDTGMAAKTQEIAGEILAVVQVVAISVAVIVLIFVAIKYISAAPNDKAEIKKHMVVYVVGAVILFATSGILELIKNFAAIID